MYLYSWMRPGGIVHANPCVGRLLQGQVYRPDQVAQRHELSLDICYPGQRQQRRQQQQHNAGAAVTTAAARQRRQQLHKQQQ